MTKTNYEALTKGNKNNTNEEKPAIETSTKNLTKLLSQILSQIGFMEEANAKDEAKILTDLFSGEIQKPLKEINSQISENVLNKSEKTDSETTPDLSKKTEEESPIKDSPIENLTKLLEVNFMKGMNSDEKANVISALHSKEIREQLGEIISKLTSNSSQQNSDTKTASSINEKDQKKYGARAI